MPDAISETFYIRIAHFELKSVTVTANGVYSNAFFTGLTIMKNPMFKYYEREIITEKKLEMSRISLHSDQASAPSSLKQNLQEIERRMYCQIINEQIIKPELESGV